MSIITLEHVKGREVADRLAEKLRLDPERTYRVTVQAEDEELAAAGSIKEVMNSVGDRAKERGLTPDILREILDDA